MSKRQRMMRRRTRHRSLTRRDAYVAPITGPTMSFDGLNRDDLRKECKERGIAYSQMRVADMRAALAGVAA